MRPFYTFHTLDPRPGAANPVLDRPCLGVEVTVAALARRCSWGNIDPQHGEHSQGSISEAETRRHPLSVWPEIAPGDSACSYAWRASESAALAGDTALVTVRPDVDSIATMAVLLLRQAGLDRKGDGKIAARVHLIASRDAFAPGAGWAPRRLPTVAEPWPAAAAPVSETESLAPLGVICSPARGQPQHAMPLRVAIVACWLLGGYPPSISGTSPWALEYAVADDVCEAAGVEMGATYDMLNVAGYALDEAWNMAREGRIALARARAEGKIRIRVALDGPPVGGSYYEGDGATLALSEYENEFSYTGRRARIAVIESAHTGALGLGYCIAPIVIAALPPNEQGRVKMTIAAWGPRYVDFSGLKAALNDAESAARGGAGLADTWGGGATILGSPQGTGTVLSIENVVRLLRAHLIP